MHSLPASTCDIGVYCSLLRAFLWLSGDIPTSQTRDVMYTTSPRIPDVSGPQRSVQPHAISTKVGPVLSHAPAVSIDWPLEHDHYAPPPFQLLRPNDNSSVESLPSPADSEITSWPGWEGISYIFSFGDSYTATHFDWTGRQPDAVNPLGNPPFPGNTRAWGPNWLDYLTVKYNKSFIQTYNFAEPGAMVDLDVVNPKTWRVPSFKMQLRDRFMPFYAPNVTTVPWRSNDTLFTIFFGINDIDFSWEKRNDTIIPLVFKQYENLVERLYDIGARNFLFNNVPPIDRSPRHRHRAPENVEWIRELVDTFNMHLPVMIQDLRRRHHDIMAVHYNTWITYTRILDRPTLYEETKGLLNTTEYCQAYDLYGDHFMTQESWYTFHAQCGIPLNKYFWGNPLHTTSAVHNATARSIAYELSLDQTRPVLLSHDDETS